MYKFNTWEPPSCPLPRGHPGIRLVQGHSVCPHCRQYHNLFSYFRVTQDCFQQTDRHTHTCLTALFLGLPGWAGTRKAKPIWILLKGWQWHQLDRMLVCTSLLTDNHASTHHSVFLQVGCPSCRPTNNVKALKADRQTGKQTHRQKSETNYATYVSIGRIFALCWSKVPCFVSVCLSPCPPVYLSIHLSVCIAMCDVMFAGVCPSNYLFVLPSICPCVCLLACVSVWLVYAVCWCTDDDYVKFVERLECSEPEVIATPEMFLEEIEVREKQAKGQQSCSHLLAYSRRL